MYPNMLIQLQRTWFYPPVQNTLSNTKYKRTIVTYPGDISSWITTKRWRYDDNNNKDDDGGGGNDDEYCKRDLLANWKQS